jgi:hypothetical protein
MSANRDQTLEQPDRLTGVNYLELTFALMGGVVAWLTRLILSSALVPYACQINSTWPLWTTTALTALVTAAALWFSLRFWRRGSQSDDDANLIGTAGWLGFLGIIFNVTSMSAIVLESVPIMFLDPCRA